MAEKQEATQADQSDSKVDESKAVAYDALGKHMLNEAPVAASTDSEEAHAGDQEGSESSKSEEVVEKDQTSEDKTDTSKEEVAASQSEDEGTTETVVEKKTSVKDTEKEKEGLEGRLGKIEKSYKSLEAEFTRKSQRLSKLDEEVGVKDDTIRKLQQEIKVLKGETLKRDPSIVDELREKNPDAANLVDRIKQEAVREARAEFQKELQTLKSDASRVKADENLSSFGEQLDAFSKGKYSSLENELMDVIDKFYPNEDDLKAAAQKDPELFDKLFEKLVFQHRAKVVQLESKPVKKNATSSSSESSKQRDAEIAKSKGVVKSKSSSAKEAEEDWTDLSDINKFKRAPKKARLAWLKSKGFGDKDSFSNLK